ncbi:endonuclease domain-containing 1 protein-like [Puntigrus tetrazona]|uniref:endonuclease domain-containing 1 protein-like n=1 Tax=Puntigrus tetrazona TaxID=1606681 RepID=UPI001C89660B|nr:endonuclease domain-containing 1 protein-like [Puntigrus tetrazona]
MRLFFVSGLLALGFPFIRSDFVDSFSTCSDFFLKGTPPTIPGILEKSVSENKNQYQAICQEANNMYRYATLYDTKNRIPVFSAYKYTGRSTDFNAPKRNWKIHPGLENTEQYYHNNQLHLTRGHIFPMSYAADVDAAKSTCDMINIVPQVDRFNDGSWGRMEQKVKSVMDSQCRDEKDNNKILAYGLTGAVPSQNKLLEEKVNIPSHMWTAFCCFNSKSRKWESLAHWAENVDESDDKAKSITEQSLEKLQEFLKSMYNTEYAPFNGECMDLFVTGEIQPQ